MRPPYKYIIGIDPGTKTGVAVWDCLLKDFTMIGTFAVVEAIDKLRPTLLKRSDVLIRCENPNTWKPFGNMSRKESDSRLQGAGSVKRDFAIWNEVASYYDVAFEPVKLQGTLKKLSPETFGRMTGYKKRTSEHARDAAMLVYKYN